MTPFRKGDRWYRVVCESARRTDISTLEYAIELAGEFARTFNEDVSILRIDVIEEVLKPENNSLGRDKAGTEEHPS